MLLTNLNETIKKHKNKGLNAIDKSLMKLGPKLKYAILPVVEQAER